MSPYTLIRWDLVKVREPLPEVMRQHRLGLLGGECRRGREMLRWGGRVEVDLDGLLRWGMRSRESQGEEREEWEETHDARRCGWARWGRTEQSLGQMKIGVARDVEGTFGAGTVTALTAAGQSGGVKQIARAGAPSGDGDGCR
jgi:hypothetical protein